MATLQVEHGVRDFERWKSAFDSDPVGREASGVRSYRILRLADDPARVIIELEFDTTEEAEGFREKLRGMWVVAGGDLGLENPSARVLGEVETGSYRDGG